VFFLILNPDGWFDFDACFGGFSNYFLILKFNLFASEAMSLRVKGKIIMS
jgi:hypothetical protein